MYVFEIFFSSLIKGHWIRNSIIESSVEWETGEKFIIRSAQNYTYLQRQKS